MKNDLSGNSASPRQTDERGSRDLGKLDSITPKSQKEKGPAR